MIRETLNRLFLIREGEVRVTLLMQLYIFLVITVLLIVKPTVNALFLSELGAKELPFAYMLTAISAVVGFYFYNRAVVRFSLRPIIYSTLAVFSSLFLILSLMIYQGTLSAVALYVFYIAVALFAVLTTSQFWLFANMVYNTREAKRLFGFIGAGAISGGIAGGYLTSLISSSAGNKTAVLVAAILLLCCIPILSAIWHLRVRKIYRSQVQSKQADHEQGDLPTYRLVLQSKHLRNLAGIVAISVVIAKLVDFQFSDFANREIPDADELASFFGFWFSTFNVLALLIQLFLTSHILDRMGVTSSLLLLPLALAMGSLLFLLLPVLWVVVLLKGTDGSFKQSINKAAMELSIMPLPIQVKNQAKSFIDVVVDSISAGAAGLLLFFVVRELDIATRYVTVLILFFLFVWVILIYKLREAYFESFRKNLRSNLPTFKKEDRKGAATLRHARKILSQKQAEDILPLLEHLADYHLKALKEELLKLLDHPDNRVKTKTLRILRGYKKGTATAKVKTLLKDDSPEVVIEAMEYLMDHSFLNDDSLFQAYLDDKDDKISGAALLCLARTARTNKKIGQRYEFHDRLNKGIAEINAIEENAVGEGRWIAIMRSVGHANIPEFNDHIAGWITSSNEQVVREAIYTAGLTADPRFIPDLLLLLEKKGYRKIAMKALRAYGAGISRTLLLQEKQELLPEKVRPYIARVLGEFPTTHSQKVLLRLLKSRSVRTRLAAARELRKLKSRNENLKFRRRTIQAAISKECNYYRDCLEGIKHFHYLLSREEQGTEKSDRVSLENAREDFLLLLKEQASNSFDCLFSLLSLHFERSDIEVAFLGLKSEKEDTVNNALEFLDNLLSGRLKRNIIPLLEYGAMEKFNYDQLPGEAISGEKRLYQRLMLKRGKRSKLAGLRLIKLQRHKQHHYLAQKLRSHKSKDVREAAKRALKY